MAEGQLCIDRLEGNFAVCEYARGGSVKLPISSLPAGAKEGDCLKIDASGNVAVDIEETERRRVTIIKLQQQIFSEE